MGEKIHTKSFRFSEQELEELNTLAAARGLSRTELICRLIKEDLERRSQLVDEYKKLQKLRE